MTRRGEEAASITADKQKQMIAIEYGLMKEVEVEGDEAEEGDEEVFDEGISVR